MPAGRTAGTAGMRRHLTTSAVARLLGVAVGSVSNWIDQGKLKAGKTPGGHRRVATADLVEFLRRQKLPVPAELVSPPRILVVDDEPSVTQWLAETIRSRHPDYEVVEAHDGFAAGELVGSLRPDVVILDLRMPGLDGFEVCRRIKANEATSGMAVIAITAYPSPEAERRALECGASAYLTKPLDVPVLLKKLAAALRRKR